jgi:hypothetical protein
MDSRTLAGTLSPMTSWTTPDAAGAPSPQEIAITWREEIEIAIRDGLQCRVCDTPLVPEDERLIVRVEPQGGDGLENLALVCAACRNAHAVHPQPIPPYGERIETVT